MNLRWENLAGELAAASTAKASFSLYTNSTCSNRIKSFKTLSFSPKNGQRSFSFVRPTLPAVYAKAISSPFSSSCLEIPSPTPPCLVTDVPHSATVSLNQQNQCKATSCVSDYILSEGACYRCSVSDIPNSSAVALNSQKECKATACISPYFLTSEGACILELIQLPETNQNGHDHTLLVKKIDDFLFLKSKNSNGIFKFYFHNTINDVIEQIPESNGPIVNFFTGAVTPAGNDNPVYLAHTSDSIFYSDISWLGTEIYKYNFLTREKSSTGITFLSTGSVSLLKQTDDSLFFLVNNNIENNDKIYRYAISSGFITATHTGLFPRLNTAAGFGVIGDNYLYRKNNSFSKQKLYKTNLYSGTTSQVVDISGPQISDALIKIAITDDVLYYSANYSHPCFGATAVTCVENDFYAYNSLQNINEKLAESDTTLNGSDNPQLFYQEGEKIFYTSQTSQGSVYGLFLYDESTREIVSLANKTSDSLSRPFFFVKYKSGFMYFNMGDNLGYSRLYKYNPSTKFVYNISNLNLSADDSAVFFSESENKVFFKVRSSYAGQNLCGSTICFSLYVDELFRTDYFFNGTGGIQNVGGLFGSNPKSDRAVALPNYKNNDLFFTWPKINSYGNYMYKVDETNNQLELIYENSPVSPYVISHMNFINDRNY